MSNETFEAYGSATHRAIQPTFDLLSVLCGRGDLPPALQRVAKLKRDKATLDDLVLDPTLKKQFSTICEAAQQAQQTGKTTSLPWIITWGAKGAGKQTLASKLAAYAGRPALLFNPALADKGTLDDLMRRAQREALMRGAVLYIGPLGGDLISDQGKELMKRIQDYPSVVVLGLDGMQPPRIRVERPSLEVQMGLPPDAFRLQLWEQVVPADTRDENVDLKSISRGFNLTPGEIIDTATECSVIAKSEKNRKILHNDLRSSVDRRLRNELGDMARRISVSTTWKDLVLSPEDLSRVQEFISRKLYATQVFEDWGYGARVGYGKGMIALFSGPPGTGKTMLAGLIANTLDLDMYQVDLASVVSKWVGETEKQLAKVFDQAERAHAVLLFDEADSLFAKRTEVKSSNDRYGNLAVNYLLQRLEQYTGVAILTTNKEAAIDEAVQRRLSLHLHLEIPEADERERLWRSFMPEKAPVDTINFRELAESFQLSGGYIKNAALRAAFLAASNKTPIQMNLLRRAAALELEDMGRLVMRGEPAKRHNFA
jgi:SpoVK/Ycf46/Vps4 family AAA+-type ATPase